VERWDRGGDPEPELREAVAAFQQAITLAPEQGFGQNNLAGAYLQQAEYEETLARDPSASLDQAEVAIRAALERIPGRAGPWAILGAIQWMRAQRDAARGRDPTPRLKLAEDTLADSLRLNGKGSIAWRYVGEVAATRAGWEAAHGRGPEAQFEKAAQAFERAGSLDPLNLELRLRLAEVLRELGVRLGQTAKATTALAKARSNVEAVLAARPHWAQAVAVRAAVLAAMAEGADPGAATSLRDEARSQLSDALRDNPKLSAKWEPLAAALRR
jgi:tetratricopeptide (TPR) repeat protein